MIWQGGHVEGQYNRIFLEEFRENREVFLFLTTNIAAVTSRANQQIK